MKHKIVKHQFLIFSLVFIAVALLLRIFFINETKNQEQYANTIEKEINKQLDIIHNDLTKVAEHIYDLEEYSFTSLNLATKYPYYIFNRGNLFYWSDFKFVPDYNSIAGAYDYRYVNLKSGRYVSHKINVVKGNVTFELYSFLPILSQNKIDNSYISSGFNEDVFSNTSLSIKTFSSPGDADIYAENGAYIFSIGFLRGFQFNPLWNKILVIGMIVAGIVFFLIYLNQKVSNLVRAHKEVWAFCLLGLSLCTIRGAMLLLDFPSAMTETGLFNSRYFASSIINPSLGDLMLNNLVLFFVIYFVAKNAYKPSLIKSLKSLKEHQRFIGGVVFVILSYAALYFEFYIIRTLYYHSQWSLDITSSITFSSFKIFSLFIFFLNALIYFLISHTIFKLLVQMLKGQFLLLALAFGLGTLLFVTVAHFGEFYFGVVVIVHFVYFCLLYFFNLPSSFQRVKYNTFLYFFVSALASAVVGAFAVFTFEQTKNVNSKNQFANQLLIDNDIRGEYLLSEAAAKIKSDIFIKNRLYSPFYSKEIIEQKIRRVYLNNYLDRYDIQVHLFNAQGRPFNNYEIPGFSVFVNAFAHSQYETDYPGIYFINETSISALKRYLVFIDINRYGSRIGYIVLDLKLKKIIPNSVYPELIVDKRFIQPEREKQYSYGIFQEGTLTNNSGMFNYQKDFNEDLLKNSDLYDKGITFKGYHHLGIHGSDEKVIVVSSEVYPLRNILANFSFLFLILVFTTSLMILANTFYKGKGRINLNFASKIQLYLNLAFFLPLLIVSVSTLSLISSSYRKDIIQRYHKKAESISTNIVNSLDSYANNQFGREQLSNELAQIARYSESDINLFSTNGRLITTSQPTIYENELLSEYINPDALATIREQNSDQVILEEKVGSLLYKSAYVAVKSFETGELMGILSIPFFESQYELEEEIIDILANIMNVFTFIFIIILIVSYFASRVLTYPLKYITQKIKGTSLATYNEPLVWHSNDEIGLLIGEYNRMLENLEESKKALSQSEKESAWREMAKQVAHEIKNPLTPMKLTLQHLNRILQENKDAHKEAIAKSINTLLQQIDTLSDIATSFSSFAKMPIPKQERFEIVGVVKRAVTLFNNEMEADVNFQTNTATVFVEGDKQLMGRICTNLIINGIQSVPSSRTPQIDVALEVKGERVVIRFNDNGEGISDTIKDKIFVPNFSTKYAGSGIGLAIAKRGIEHAGGTLGFETQIGIGTTFFISLPVMN